MADYGKVFRRVWSNPKFRRGSEDARSLTLYLLTNEHGTSEGLYRLPAAYAAADLQWTAERYEKAFAEVEGQGFIERDAEFDMVLIVNALEFNRPTTENHIKGAANVLAEVRDSPLRQRFMQQCDLYCPALLEVLTSQNGWSLDPVQTESAGSPKGVPMESAGSPDAIDMEPEGSRHSPPPPPPPPLEGQDILAKADALPDTVEPYEAEFDIWWQTYPRKVKKQAAFNAYKARRRAGTTAEDITRSVEHYAKSRIGEPEAFTMHAATFLNGNKGPWLEWLTGAPEKPAAAINSNNRQARSRAALDEWASRFEAADSVGELSA